MKISYLGNFKINMGLAISYLVAPTFKTKHLLRKCETKIRFVVDYDLIVNSTTLDDLMVLCDSATMFESNTY